MELDELLKEHDLSMAGFMDPETVKKIGLLSGTDAIIVGNVENYDYEVFDWTESHTSRDYQPGDKAFSPTGPRHTTYTTYYKKNATITITFKILKTETGDIAWSNTASGNYWVRGKGNYVAGWSEYNLFEKAMEKALNEVRWLYPHKRAFRVPVK